MVHCIILETPHPPKRTMGDRPPGRNRPDDNDKKQETKHLRSGYRESESVQECQRAVQQPQYDSTVPSSAALTYNQTAALSNNQSSNDRHLLDILLDERRRCRIQLDALEQQRSRLINYQDPRFSASSVSAGQRPPTTSAPVRFESRMSSAAIIPSPSNGRDPHNLHPPLNLQNWAGFPTSRASSAGAPQFWSGTRGMVEDADYPMQRRQRRESPLLEERKRDGTEISDNPDQVLSQNKSKETNTPKSVKEKSIDPRKDDISRSNQQQK
jgi:hypothetical protein